MGDGVADQVDIFCRGAILVVGGIGQRRARIEADDAGRPALKHCYAGTVRIEFLGDIVCAGTRSEDQHLLARDIQVT